MSPSFLIPPAWRRFPFPNHTQQVLAEVLSSTARALLDPNTSAEPHRHPESLGMGVHLAPHSPPAGGPSNTGKSDAKTIPFPAPHLHPGDPTPGPSIPRPRSAVQTRCRDARTPTPTSSSSCRSTRTLQTHPMNQHRAPHRCPPATPGSGGAPPAPLGSMPAHRSHSTSRRWGDPATLVWPLSADLHDKSPILANLGDLPTSPARGVNGFSLPRPSCHFD